MHNSVELQQSSLKEVLVDKRLKIPPYQRIYCWPETTVNRLLNDLINIDSDQQYCIGSIILQYKDNNTYDIIDGQQRLVTIALLLLELGLDRDNPISLLDETFADSDALRYIKYNRFLINNFCSRNTFENKDHLLERIILNVLILKDGSLDLAYTFFSNENSHGKPLSDYDLLKAHHLRYVLSEAQQAHLAKRWDTLMLSAPQVDSDYKDYEQVLKFYIFRLRKWLAFDWWNEEEKYIVKTEFEASSVVEAVPSFGERFCYYEPIQGGTHFFEFTDKAIEKLAGFKQTDSYERIHKLNVESFILLRDAIEALMFAYYYKFGNSYLTEAMLLITRYVSQVRYENKRIYMTSVFEHIRLSKIPLLIETSSSPTFFLAKMYEMNNSLMNLSQIKSQDNSKRDIRERYNKRLSSVCFNDIEEKSLVLKKINEWK